MSRTHDCPAPGCPLRAPNHWLACKTHMRELPVKLKRTLADSYDAGDPKTATYLAAAAEARAILNRTSPTSATRDESRTR